MQSSSLVETYGRLGEIAANLHSIQLAHELRRHPELADRLCNAVVPKGVREGIQRALAGKSRQCLLHGDLNASNVVLARFPIAIDFDDCGVGVPELELAISLGYVNTSPCDIRDCFQSMVSRYTAQNFDLDVQTLGRLCGYIPWYLAASQYANMPPEKVETLDLKPVRWQASAIQNALSEFGPWYEC